MNAIELAELHEQGAIIVGVNTSIAKLAKDTAAELRRLHAENESLKAARYSYASLFNPNTEGEPDTGRIHENIRCLKAENESLRKDAGRYRFIRDVESVDDFLNVSGDEFDHAIDAAMGEGK